jgi:hypothetical protein
VGRRHAGSRPAGVLGSRTPWRLGDSEPSGRLKSQQLFADHCGQFDFDILKGFCAQHAPWMTAEEIDDVFIRRRRQGWSADDLAIALRLMDAKRTALGIHTIGAV